MRSVIITSLLLVFNACGRIDAEDAVALKLSGSGKARFQSVRRSGDAVCGEVKAGEEGTADRYRRFVYSGKLASIAPDVIYSPADIAAFETTCRLLAGRGNELDREVCKRAADARRTQHEAAAFASQWQDQCN